MQARTRTPLLDRFIDEHLVEMLPLFDQAWIQLVNVINPAAIHMLLQLPPNLHGLLGISSINFFAPNPFSCVSTLINTRQSAENIKFIVYGNCLRYIGNKRYFVIGIWRLTRLSNNILSWNLCRLKFSSIVQPTFLKLCHGARKASQSCLLRSYGIPESRGPFANPEIWASQSRNFPD